MSLINPKTLKEIIRIKSDDFLHFFQNNNNYKISIKKITEHISDFTIKNLPDIPTNHSDLFFDDGTNPHSTTKDDVGLSNVDNTSDADKPVSNLVSSSLNSLSNQIDTKQDILVSGTGIKTINGESILGAGDFLLPPPNWENISGDISDNTDLQNALDAKEPTIAVGTSAEYYRGDKTFQTLDKTAVGLANVDNTSDADKVISDLTVLEFNNVYNEINNKQDTLVNGNGTTANGSSVDLGGALTQPVTIISGSSTELLDIGGNTSGINLAQVRSNSTSYQGNHLTAYDGTGVGTSININPGGFSSSNSISPVSRTQILNGSSSSSLYLTSNKIVRLYLNSFGSGITPGSGESYSISNSTFTEGIDFTGQGNYILDAATIAGLNYTGVVNFVSVTDEGSGFIKFVFSNPVQVSETLTDGNFLLFNWESSVQTNNDGVELEVRDVYGITYTSLLIRDNQTIFTDNSVIPKGIQYDANYDATLVDDSLVPKRYADTKESAITAGTTSEYYRGDKTFQTLDKTAVGLENVDNTSDVNKPVSTAQQTEINTKNIFAYDGVSASPLTRRTKYRAEEFIEFEDDAINEETIIKIRPTLLAEFTSTEIIEVNGQFYLALDENKLYQGNSQGLAEGKTLSQILDGATGTLSASRFHLVGGFIEPFLDEGEIYVGNVNGVAIGQPIADALDALAVETGIRFKIGIDSKVAIDLPEGEIIKGNANNEGVASPIISGNNKILATDNSGVTYEADSVDFADILTGTATVDGLLSTTDLNAVASGVKGSFKITNIVIENTTANEVTLDIGSDTGLNDISSNVLVGANGFVDVSVLKALFSKTIEQDIYVSSADWNSSNLIIKISVQKVF